MKTKKILSFFMAVMMLFGITTLFAFGAEDELDALKGKFEYGIGPETEGFAIDYRYYSPVKQNDSTKYPLVIWLHGMGDGAYDKRQIERSNIALWASEDYQSRFKNSNGAFILAARSVEEKELYWTDELIFPLRAAIDDFIEKNKANVDTSRIYVGGYSMGGKMTLKMAVAYPEMFAAAFPICPAWVPGAEAAAKLSDMPIWLTSGVADPLVNYFAMTMPTWKNIISESKTPENCRFSSLSITTYANGIPTSSGHHSWFAVNNDMFSSKNGNYPAMKTVDGMGEKLTLSYPDGMISWLSGFSCDFGGEKATDSGNAEAVTSDGMKTDITYIKTLLTNFIEYILSLFKIK